MEHLTLEQESIIQHPPGNHARVLAVAGSGKTTTMVYRVAHLINNLKEDPSKILVVMFNRLTREQFLEKVSEILPGVSKNIKIYTFHALAYRLWKDGEKLGLVEKAKDVWFGEREELVRICVLRVIESLLKEKLIEDVDPEEALNAIGLWKASLIPPQRAGHKHNPYIPVIYKRFEEVRLEKGAITFDDFIPEAMRLIEGNKDFRKRWSNRVHHLIADEYQDVNYGQQQLIRLLAGNMADVMVVGDDDQTIYEWRAARPWYILEGFKKDFLNKPVIDYTLSHSFRFGPLVAQAAYNVIAFNQHREEKPLVCHDVNKATGLTVLDSSEGSNNLSMAEEADTLVKEQNVMPKDIGILGRTFAQLESLQAAFIDKKIPFRVLGMNPFYQRDENRTIIDYIRLALAWDYPVKVMKPWNVQRKIADEEDSMESFFSGKSTPCGEAVRTVIAVANKPSRKLSRLYLQQAVEKGLDKNMTVGNSLLLLLDERISPFVKSQRESMKELVNFLSRIRERIESEPQLQAGELLQWIVDTIGYNNHFKDYYGEGMTSAERMASVKNFIDFAARSGRNILDFIKYLKSLDSTLGYPPDKVITMTTIHRTKGLEYDYVFIPDCIEGHMPVHLADDIAVYDKENKVPDNPSSSPLENERRIFYVALTRGKKHVYIGTGIRNGQVAQPSRFLEEIQLEPTREIISAVKEIFETEELSEEQINRLKKTLTSCRYTHLSRYVIEHYLSSHDEIDWKELMNSVPFDKRVFSYSSSYSLLNTSVSKVNFLWAKIGSVLSGGSK